MALEQQAHARSHGHFEYGVSKPWLSNAEVEVTACSNRWAYVGKRGDRAFGRPTSVESRGHRDSILYLRFLSFVRVAFC